MEHQTLLTKLREDDIVIEECERLLNLVEKEILVGKASLSEKKWQMGS